MVNKKITAAFVLIASFFAFKFSYAYPNLDKAQLALTGVTSQAKQMYLTGDNRYLYLGFSNKVKVVDMGTFALLPAGEQPYDFSTSETLNGVVGGIALSTNYLYVSQDNGNMLRFGRSNLAAEPTSITIAGGKTLGKMGVSADGANIYIINEDDNTVALYGAGSGTLTTIPLIATSAPTINDLLLVPSAVGGSDYVYLATNKGSIYVIINGQTTASGYSVAGESDNLTGLSIRPNKSQLYVADTTEKSVLVMTPTTLVSPFEVTLLLKEGSGGNIYNDSLVSTISVSADSSYYTYASGVYGLSVLNGNNALIDAATGSYTNNPVAITGERSGPMIAGTDGYIYLSGEGGSISVVTQNPYITVSDVTYSGGGTSMGIGGSVAITFRSDTAGTFKTLIGGGLDQSGTQATDAGTTGSVVAATDTVVTITYDGNSSAFQEGANTVFFFVTSGSLTGRGGATVTVDTPPPQVYVTGTNFGNARMYVYFNRINVSDMSYYNVYAGTNTDAVDNRTVTPVRVNQPSSGSEVTAELSGLANGVRYYASVEAVDAAGNVGTLATYIRNDGTTRITDIPEQTVGPAELMGEKGCSLIKGNSVIPASTVIPAQAGISLILFTILLLFLRRKAQGIRRTVSMSSPRKRGSITLSVIIIILLLSLSQTALAVDDEKNPKWWSTDVQGFFWIPTNNIMKDFFQPCCNMGGKVEQGFLYQSKYGVGLGAGFQYLSGTAVSIADRRKSGDKFNLLLIPMETNFVFRADFFNDQIVVPYTKFGFDYVYFRQDVKGSTLNGVKTGLHVIGGIQVLLDFLDSGAENSFEEDYGINDIYLTFEGRYNWINDFGGGGLDLSGVVCSFGLLFEY